MTKIYILKEHIEQESDPCDYEDDYSDFDYIKNSNLTRPTSPKIIILTKITYFSSKVSYETALKQAAEYGSFDSRPSIESAEVEVDFNRNAFKLMPIKTFIKRLNSNAGGLPSIEQAKESMKTLINRLEINYSVIAKRRQAFLFGFANTAGAYSSINRSLKNSSLALENPKSVKEAVEIIFDFITPKYK